MTNLDPRQQSWMTAPHVAAAMDALTAGGGEARFVGGAVRNALIGAAVADVDIATPLLPGEVERRLTQAGLAAVPTGIEHGTLTAVAFGKPVEVTTLRRDVSTDGRRATVAFTEDWAEDAARRDFTMNALYAARNGKLFDFVGGVADARDGRVRFVGEPRARIREDYLRILRLFRFHAWYGKGDLEPDAIAAAAAEKAGIGTLSGERVQKEMLRLLAAKAPVGAVRIMASHGILREIFPVTSLEPLARLVDLENNLAAGIDPLLRLAALLPDQAASRAAAARLKLSNADRERLIGALGGSDADFTPRSAPAAIYRQGRERFRDRLLLRWARVAPESANAGAFDEAERLTQSWRVPAFPLDGRDALALGIAEGPAVGKALAAVEDWWIENGFIASRDELLARLRKQAV